MSCSEAHSRTEWYSWPPVKMFGVGSPISLSREPSVPPRIGVRSGSMPSARIASSAAAATYGSRLEIAAHVAVLRGGRRPPGCARGSAADDLLGGALQQRDVVVELVVVEVAHDRRDLGRGRPSPSARRDG